MDVRTPENILVVRTDRIGDVILSLPMLSVLHRNYPSARISIMVRPYTRELVERHPAVNDVLVLHTDGGYSFTAMVQELRRKHFDMAILPYPRFNLALMFFMAGIPIRVGTGYRWYSFLFNKKMYEHRKVAQKHEAEYNLNLLTTLGIDISGKPEFTFSCSPEHKEMIDSVLRSDGLHGKRFAILHAGSGGSARDWPLKNFSQLGDVLQTEENLPVVLTGGSSEKELVGKVEREMHATVVNYAGRFTLGELSALIQRSALFVSNSTGPLHIASIVGTPVVAFYPPIVQCSPVRWGPYTDKKVVFTADNTVCPLCKGGACRSNVCMEQISVDRVIAGIKSLLEKH